MLFNKKDKEENLDVNTEVENTSSALNEDKVDQDIEPKKEEKKISSGITTEEYDIEPEVETANSEAEDELAGKESIDIEYSFNGEEISKALTVYQALTLTKKNLIYSIILLAVFSVYVINLVKDPSNTFSIFLAVMCVVVLAFIWIMPKQHIKKTAKAVDEQNLKFTMSIYDNCVKIGEEKATFIMTFNKEITKIIDTEDMFLLCAGKQRLFVLPKHYLSDEQKDNVTKIFIDAMNENYITK